METYNVERNNVSFIIKIQSKNLTLEFLLSDFKCCGFMIQGAGLV